MTCVAWDGRRMAGDRLARYRGQRFMVTKVHRIGRLLVGAAGRVSTIDVLLEWIRAGRRKAAFPSAARRGSASVLVIERNASGVIYRCSPRGTRFDACTNAAIGSGAPHALAAMHLGKTACEAVEVACQLDPARCGIGIDVFEHSDWADVTIPREGDLGTPPDA